MIDSDRFARVREGINTLRNHSLPLLWLVLPLAALRLVPGTSEAFGPPRRAASWRDYRQQHGAEWRGLFAEHVEQLPGPFFCNDATSPLATGRTVRWPETGVGILHGARLLDEHGWIVGARDTFLGDLCYSGNGPHSRVNHIIKLHPPRRLPGRTLNLCSANAVTNFFHYVVDSVSRTELVRRAGFTWDDFDHIVLPRLCSPTTREIDEAIGLPPEKIVRLGRREQLHCETLVQPSFPGPLACTPRWVMDFYRHLWPQRSVERSRKLYFPRRGNRAPDNLDAIERRLAARGFEAVDPLHTPDLRTRLAEATHVVGVHGASLANLVFCQPGTRVLELMPTEISAHYNRWFYYTLCASGDMPYGVVIGESRRQRLTAYSPQPRAPFHIAPADLDRGLEALLAAPEVEAFPVPHRRHLSCA